MHEKRSTTGEVREAAGTLARAVRLVWSASPFEASTYAALLVVQGLLPAAQVLLLKFTVDAVTHAATGLPVSAAGIAALWVAALAGNVAAGSVNAYLQGNLVEKSTARMQVSLMRQAARQPGLDVVEDPAFHDDLDVLVRGINHRPLNLLVTLASQTRDALTVAGVMLALATFAWWVPLVLFVGVLPEAAAQVRLRRLAWGATLARTPEAREMAYDAATAIGVASAKEVRLFGLLPWLESRYLNRWLAAHTSMRRVRRQHITTALPASLVKLTVAGALLAWVTLRAARGDITAGEVVFVVQGLTHIQASLGEFTAYLGLLGEHLAFFRKYFAFLRAEPRVRHPARPRDLPAGPVDVIFERVSYRYPDGRDALRDVTLHLRVGETVALVGENGAGKSTLVKLLLRFYDPTAGRVLVGGVDLRDLDVNAWRSRVGAVFQDFGRYAYTVRENVTLADVTRAHDGARTHAAVRAAGLDGMLLDLPGGIDTRLGKEFGGTDLSGGQWQKLAVARALFREADVLVLDEPTAALDPRSEAELFASFAELARDRTALLITHRLASVRMAHRVIVLREGRVAQDGTHEELLAQGGEYAALWRLQAERYQEA